MKNDLPLFCREVLDWVEAGCPEHPVLSADKSLCCIPFEKLGYRMSLHVTLRCAFEDEYECASYPFGGEEVWDEENELGNFYSNDIASEQRIEFLRRHACST